MIVRVVYTIHGKLCLLIGCLVVWGLRRFGGKVFLSHPAPSGPAPSGNQGAIVNSCNNLDTSGI